MSTVLLFFEIILTNLKFFWNYAIDLDTSILYPRVRNQSNFAVEFRQSIILIKEGIRNMGQLINAKQLMADISNWQSPQDILETLTGMEQNMAIYESGIQEIRTKLEILQRDARYGEGHNPIESIKSRIKRPMSIIEKMYRKGFPISLQSMRENLNDVAGVRVICPFIEDIYTVAEMLTRQDDLKVIQKKDYIQNPKPNGYRSYHLVLEVPVFLSDRKEPVRVEVQLRTIAMDFWASLEHQIHYKTQHEVPDCVTAELRECADIIAHTDERMQSLSKQIRGIDCLPEEMSK